MQMFKTCANLQAYENPKQKLLLLYISQLKNVLWLEENVTRAMRQNSLTPKGNNNFNFQLACDQVVQLKTSFKVKYFLIVEQERK